MAKQGTAGKKMLNYKPEVKFGTAQFKSFSAERTTLAKWEIFRSHMQGGKGEPASGAYALEFLMGLVASLDDDFAAKVTEDKITEVLRAEDAKDDSRAAESQHEFGSVNAKAKTATPIGSAMAATGTRG